MSVDTRAAVAAPPAARPPSTWRSLLAVIGRGMRDHRRAPLTWGGGLGAMSALMALLWPSIEGSMDELMESYPQSLKDAFGIDQLDSVEKYVDAEMLSLIVPLALIFFAVRSVTRPTVGAEDRGHIDTVLALPLSRRILVAGSFLVTAIVVAAILATIWGLTWGAGTIAGTGISAGQLAAGVANVWPLAMLFAGLAVLLAGRLRRPSTVTGIAAGAAVATYVVDVLGKLADSFEPARIVSAFRYYGSAIQDGLDVSHMVGLTVAAVLLAAVGAVLFDRRDIH